jgi:hypothetical protein
MTKQVAEKKTTDLAVANWKAELGELAENTKNTDIAASNVIQCMDAEFILGEDTFTEFSAIVLDTAHVHAYYTTGYDPDDPIPPACFAVGLAHDDVVMSPVGESPEPQSKTCDKCAKNEFGTADTGKGKACSQRRRLLLLAVEDPNNLHPDNIAASDVAVLNIPTTSIKNWRAYASHVKKHEKVYMQQVVTSFKIVKDKKTRHKVEFEVGSITANDEIMSAILNVRRENIEELLRAPDFTGYGEEEDEAATAAVDAKL